MSDYLHGVETTESDEINLTISDADISSVVIIGTAPSYLLDDAAVLNKITNFTEAKKYVGNNIDGFTLPDAVQTVLTESGGANIYTINIFDEESHTSNVSKSITFTNGECTLSELGVQNLVLTKDDTELTLNTDYTFKDNTITVLSGGALETDVILDEFLQITDGSMVISLNNETYTVSGLDFSEVEDLAGVAKILQTAIRANTGGGALWTGAAVTCSEDDEEDTVTFTLTAGLIGAYDIGYATAAEETEEETEQETTSVIGSDISSLIGWSEETEPTITTGEALTLTTSGNFDVTTANGTIYTISDTLEFTADSLESGGTYKIFIDPVNKSISLTQNEITTGSAFPADAETGDYLLNTSQIPYDLQEKTDSGITKGLNEVYAGVLTLSGGGVI